MNSWSDFNAVSNIEQEREDLSCSVSAFGKSEQMILCLYPLHFYVGSIDEHISWSNSR